MDKFTEDIQMLYRSDKKGKMFLQVLVGWWFVFFMILAKYSANTTSSLLNTNPSATISFSCLSCFCKSMKLKKNILVFSVVTRTVCL